MKIWRSIRRSRCASQCNQSKTDYKNLDFLRSLSCLLSAVVLMCTASGAIAEDDAPGPKLALGQGQPIWNERDRAQSQLPIWPDMPLGALKTGSNEYLWFGPGSRGTRETEGTYVLRGSLDSFQPYNVNGKGIPQLSMHMGSIQPSPDGNDFDRDYAGGGPAYCITPQGDLTGECEEHAPIIVVYHGELH